MIFKEYNNLYFRALEKLIALAIDGKLTEEKLFSTVQATAFSESAVFIEDAIKNGEWNVIDKDLTTPYEHVPYLPLTLIEKRWLKALFTDKRIRLFVDEEPEFLYDVSPLFNACDVIYPDKFDLGDDYESETYVKNFKTVLRCIKENKKVKIRYKSPSGNSKEAVYVPRRIEYSAKDDKFRLLAGNVFNAHVLNIGRIAECWEDEPFNPSVQPSFTINREEVTFEILNQRNCLERALIHFSAFEKETVRVEADRFLVKMKYPKDMETEILIRLMQFGQFVKILEPEGMVEQIKNRIFAQKTDIEACEEGRTESN